MFLDLGNHRRIDDPTPEQIEYQVRNLATDALFIILSADEEHFIQAMPEGEHFRVEWRQEARQRFTLVPVSRAAEAFLAFQRWDEPVLEAFSWRQINVWNDPYRRVLIAAVVFVVITLIIFWAVICYAA